MSQADARQSDDDLTWRDRYAYTPLRDALRGNWKARPTLARTIRAAALPDSLGGLIEQVVRHTKLWRRERLEVARELIAHFADGLESGRSPQELERTFGDAQAAAKLIRRAKKRNRSVTWKTWVRTWQSIGVVLGLLLCIYLYGAVRVFSGSPRPSRDYLAVLNATAAAVPSDQRAWPLYRQALIELGEMPDLPETRLPDWNDPKWLTMREYLQEHEASLEVARRAAALPGMGLVLGTAVVVSGQPSQEDGALWVDTDATQITAPLTAAPLLNILLPHLGKLRTLSRVLHLDACRAASMGEAATVAGDIAAMLGLAQHTREHPLLISELVGFAILAQALQTLGDVLAEWPALLSDAQLKDLAHQLAAMDRPPGLRTRLDGERLFFYDFIQHAYTDDGEGGGRLTAQGAALLRGMNAVGEMEGGSALAAPIIGIVSADRKSLLQEYERLMSKIESQTIRPLWQMRLEEAEREAELYSDSLWLQGRYGPIAFLMPAMAKSIVHAELVAMERDGTVVAIALELFRRRFGNFPATLDELVPSFLPSVAVDRFDGKPLRYRLQDGRPLLYSIGANRVDDGGAVPADGRQAARRWIAPEHLQALREGRTAGRIPDGDWILWPRPADPPPATDAGTGAASHLAVPSP